MDEYKTCSPARFLPVFWWIAFFVEINFHFTIMQFYYAVALCFLGALIRHTAAESAVQLPTGPLFLPNNSTGAAVVVTSGYTRIYYLAPDGSIHELRGSGVPRPGAPYVDILRVPASKVRTNSPLAAVGLKKDDEDVRVCLSGESDCRADLSFCRSGFTSSAPTIISRNTSYQL